MRLAKGKSSSAEESQRSFNFDQHIEVIVLVSDPLIMLELRMRPSVSRGFLQAKGKEAEVQACRGPA